MAKKKATPFKISLLVENKLQKKRMAKLQALIGTDIPMVVEEPKKRRRAKKVL
jgi:hypothetical protein